MSSVFFSAMSNCHSQTSSGQIFHEPLMTLYGLLHDTWTWLAQGRQFVARETGRTQVSLSLIFDICLFPLLLKTCARTPRFVRHKKIFCAACAMVAERIDVSKYLCEL